jgi:hypothetical protein
MRGWGESLPPFVSPYICIMGQPIYYMTGTATFIKNKSPQTRAIWIVSQYDNPRDIMEKDSKTMHRLEQEFLTAKAKQRTIIINRVDNVKQIGTTCDVKEAQ